MRNTFNASFLLNIGFIDRLLGVFIRSSLLRSPDFLFVFKYVYACSKSMRKHIFVKMKASGVWV